jgi:preprotein translocase subunit SecA
MRLFGSERIAGIMDRLGLGEGEMIQHSMITKSIERAQKKVEENNFGIRKRLLEYDDVMNSQREVIYRRRKNALSGERLSVDIANLIYDVSENIIDTYHPIGDYENFRLELLRSFSMSSPVTEKEFLQKNPQELTNTINNVVIDTYKRKVNTISSEAYPVIKDVFERQAHVYENVVVPISDGIKIYQVVTNLKASAETEGRDLVRSYEKTVVLATIDEMWKEHLREMDELKQSVQNATYEQKDPLLIYKFESFELFKTMIERVNRGVISTLMKGHIHSPDPDKVREAERRKRTDMSRYSTSKSDFSSLGEGGERQQERGKKAEPVRVDKKVGRNDPCPCGSGKKYKQCHGRTEPGAGEPRPVV